MTTDRPLAHGRPPRFATWPVLGVAAGLVAVLVGLAHRYGPHRDELYFVVAGQHLDWGYVDQPPLTPLLARLATEAFGEGLTGLRLVPAVLAGVVVVLTALIAREAGGGGAAQVLAACSAAASGLVMATTHMLSTAGGDLVAWMLVLWLALRLLRTADHRLWPLLGLVVGVGLLNKHLVALLLLGLLVGVLVHRRWDLLRTPWLLAGVGIAAVVVAPNLLWQATHDWPQLTVAGGISEDDGGENRVMFVPLQLLQLSPLLVPVAVAGGARAWRLGWARPVVTAYLVIAVVVLAAGGKAYYALPPVLALVGVGCGPLVGWARSAGRRATVGVGLLLAAASSAVFTLPVLPVGSLGVVTAVNPEQGEQVGWPALAEAVADGWAQVPEAERERAVVLTSNYGEAGALWRYGDELGLPRAYSGHMSFHDWGPPPDHLSGPVLVVHPEDGSTGPHLTGCRRVAEVDNGHDLDNEEQGAQVVLCDGPRERWSDLWPALRRFY